MRIAGLITGLVVAIAAALAFGLSSAGRITVMRSSAARTLPARTVADRRPAPCTAAGWALRQGPDGRISACLRVGNVAAGMHSVIVSEWLPFTASVVPKHGARSTPVHVMAVALRVSPAIARPGQTVTVTGTLAHPHRGASHPNLCWDGCTGGLLYGDAAIRWTSRRTFRAHLIIPAVPWIATDPARVVVPTDGVHRIGIECLQMVSGCGSDTEGSATVTVAHVRPVAWCRRPASCARLTVTPGRAAPGDVVRVRGVMPLTAGPEAGLGAGSLLTPAVARPARHRAELSFSAARDGQTTLTVGRAPLRVIAPPPYARYAAPPQAVTTGGLAPLAADPADPSTVAWCAGTAVTVASAQGRSTIGTSAAVPVLRQLGFTPENAPPGLARCAAVAPIDNASGTLTGMAVGFAVTYGNSAPPVDTVALATYDGGRSWTAVPAPSGSAPAGFGGFRYLGSAVEVVYAPLLHGKDPAIQEFGPTTAAVELSDVDGHGWHAAPPACPTAGPCVTLGPYEPGNCNMDAAFQLVLRAGPSGAVNQATGFPAMVDGCSEVELVAASPRSAMLVETNGEFPVLRTTNGGRSWRVLGLPPTPRINGQLARLGPGGLTVLPDGGLLLTGGAVGETPRPWALLRPRARTWCEVRVPAVAIQRRAQLSAITPVGSELWWLTGDPAANTAPAVNEMQTAALSC